MDYGIQVQIYHQLNNGSGEFILVFDEDYDASGNQMIYKGVANSVDTIWADLRGAKYYKDKMPNDSTLSDREQRIAASPFLSALYVYGIETDSTVAYNPDGSTFYSTSSKLSLHR